MNWLISFFILTTAVANAEPANSHSLVSGNTLLRPDGVQKIVKDIIVQNLKKSIDAQNNGTGLVIQTDASEHHLKIPQKALLREILTTLGISDQIHIMIDPIQTSINFEPESLKIKIDKTRANLFVIHAHWEANELKASSKGLRIIVPKGVFSQGFEISSNPVKICLKPGLGPITADLVINVFLTLEGSKFSLEKFETNLDDESPRLKVKLGPLTVNNKPLELEILSNGQSITTDEPTIRGEFQQFEPDLMKGVQKELGKVIQKQFTSISEKLANLAPFKFSINSNELLKKFAIKDAGLSTLLKDISADFIFSYLQDLPTQKLFTTQLSSKICIGTECLINQQATSHISNEDVSGISNNEAGLILYESWLQNTINSDSFQKRVKEYYKKSLKSPGVELGDDGIKIHLNPLKNAIVAVLNLKIDIKATTSLNSALKSWSAFKDYSTKQLADIWENVAGSGQYVFLPVEIMLNLKGVQNDSKGKKQMTFETDIPFHDDGTINNSYHYKCNVQYMNSKIRKEVLASVKSEIGKSLPALINIPLDKPLEIGGVTFNINDALITKNKGLLISGGIQ